MRRWLVVLACGSTLFTSACAKGEPPADGRSGDDAPAEEPAAAPATSDVPDATAPPTPTAASGDAGAATIATSAGELLDAVVVPLDMPADAPEGFTPAGAPSDIRVAAGAVIDPVLVGVPGAAPPEDALPLLLHRDPLGVWEWIPAEYIDGKYVAEAMSFSWYWPGWADDAYQAAADAIDAGFDWVTGRTDPPEPCGDDPYPWVSDAGAPPDGAFHVCLEQNPAGDGTERVEVKIKSNRAVAMWLVIPRTGADYVWVEGSSWDTIGPILNAVTGGPPERVLLAPGRTATVGYRQPVVSTSLEFFGYQDNVTQLFSLLIKNVGEVNAELGTLLATISCFDTGVEGIGDVSWERASECMSALRGLSESQIELAYSRAVSSGRVALSRGDDAAFRSAVLSTDRLGSTLNSLKRAGNLLTAARLAADAVVLANDAALGNVTNAGTYALFLTGPAPPETNAIERIGTAAVPALCGNSAGNLVDGVLPDALVQPSDGDQEPAHVRLIDDVAPTQADLTGDGRDEIVGVVLCTFPSYGYPQGYQSLVVWDDQLQLLGHVEMPGNPPSQLTAGDGVVTVDVIQCAEDVLVCVETGRRHSELVWDGAAFGLRDQAAGGSGLIVAECVTADSMWIGMAGPDPEVAVLQRRLVELGFDPGDIDGYFGENTFVAVANSQEPYSDGTSGGNGVFVDEGTVLGQVFERLGIACD